MTMEELKTVEDDFLTASQAAGVLKMDTGRLIGYAKEGQLPFPVQISGNRVKISRKGFLDCYGYGEPEEPKEDPQIANLQKEVHLVNAALMATNIMLMHIMQKVSPETMDAIAGELTERGIKQ